MALLSGSAAVKSKLLPESPATFSEVRTTGGSGLRAAREGARLLLLAFVILLALDGLIFRLGPYKKILEPDSTTGEIELVLRRELEAQSQYGDNLVVTLGNSRMAYYARDAAKLEPQTGYYLRHAGLAGTDARSWYYMMRDLDPTASRYRAVVIAVNDYDDEDPFFSEASDLRVLHYAAVRLRLADIPELVPSFPEWSSRWEALRSLLLKGYTYQADIQGFLDHPAKRLEYVRRAKRDYPLWTWDFVEENRNLKGVDIDFSTFKITYPPNADQNQRFTVENFLGHPPVPQLGKSAAFRREWVGKILDRYRNSRTKVIFIRLPRGAIVRPDNLVKKLSSTVRDFAAARPNVLLANEHAFDSLERRELFKDGLHLNDDGIKLFTVMLSEETARLLGPPAPNWQSLPDHPHTR